MKTISKYSGAGAFIITTRTPGGIVTQLDQKRAGMLASWKRARFAAVHFLAERRGEVLARIKAARFSKPMRVIEITDKQWESRGKSAETIPGTGIAATKLQMARAFEV